MYGQTDLNLRPGKVVIKYVVDVTYIYTFVYARNVYTRRRLVDLGLTASLLVSPDGIGPYWPSVRPY